MTAMTNNAGQSNRSLSGRWLGGEGTGLSVWGLEDFEEETVTGMCINSALHQLCISGYCKVCVAYLQ